MSKRSIEIALTQARAARDALNRTSPNSPALIPLEHLVDSLKTALRSAS
jgi:transposase